MPASTGLRFGFPVYYTSSRLVVEGEWSPDVYDNAWFIARSLRPDRRPDRRDLPAEHPGGVAPRDPDRVPRHRHRPADLAGGRPRPGRGDDRRSHRRAAGPSVAATDPGRHRPVPVVGATAGDGVLGQAYALMLALQAVALWAVVRGRASAAGVAVGAAVAAKLAAIPVLLVLAVRGSIRGVAVAVGTAIVLAGLTVGFAGLDGWTPVRRRPRRRRAPPAAQCRGDGLPIDHRAVRAPVRPGSAVEPGCRRGAPRAGDAAGSPATGVALGLTLWLGRDGRADVAVGAAIAAGVLVVNLAQEHHFAMLLVPAVVSLARWLDPGAARRSTSPGSRSPSSCSRRRSRTRTRRWRMAGSPSSPIRGSTARGCSGRGWSASSGSIGDAESPTPVARRAHVHEGAVAR